MQRILDGFDSLLSALRIGLFSVAAAPVGCLVYAVAAYGLRHWRGGSGDEPPVDGPPLRGNNLITGVWLVVSTLLCVFLLVWGLAALATDDAAGMEGRPGSHFAEAERVLKGAVARDRDNPFAWYQLGIVYANSGDIPRAQLASAEQQSLSGNMSDALRNAESAMAGLKPGTSDYLRAQDIAMQARAAIAHARKRH